MEKGRRKNVRVKIAKKWDFCQTFFRKSIEIFARLIYNSSVDLYTSI